MNFNDLKEKEVEYCKETYILKALRQVPKEYCQNKDMFVVDIQKGDLTFPVNWSIVKYEGSYLNDLIGGVQQIE